jgi:hypothetical protein
VSPSCSRGGRSAVSKQSVSCEGSASAVSRDGVSSSSSSRRQWLTLKKAPSCLLRERDDLLMGHETKRSVLFVCLFVEHGPGPTASLLDSCLLR